MLELTKDFKIIDLTSKLINVASGSNISDFEDAIQFHSAKDNAKILVTRNTEDYTQVSSKMEILTPGELLEKYAQ